MKGGDLERDALNIWKRVQHKKACSTNDKYYT